MVSFWGVEASSHIIKYLGEDYPSPLGTAKAMFNTYKMHLTSRESSQGPDL